MQFSERHDGESVADHLLRNAAALALTSAQLSRLRHASRLDRPGATRRTRQEAARIANGVRAELDADVRAVVDRAECRGEEVINYNEAGAVRVVDRDGFAALLRTDPPKITNSEFALGMAYRLVFERAKGGLGSQMGRESFLIGAISSGGASASAALFTAYAMARLDAFEAAVLRTDPSGRSLNELRAIAGEGQSVNALVPKGGNGKAAAITRLRAALAAIDAAQGLRITGR